MSEIDQALIHMPIPKDDGGPIFEEPWQAQAFAITVEMHKAGHFSWSEWADLFGAEIAAATKAGRGCGNEDYYLCWLAALEKILAEKAFISPDQRAARKEAWLQAHLHTAHGEPVVLEN